MNRFVIALLSVVVWTGCAIGPDYERPFIPDPEEFRAQPQEEVDTTSLAEMPWWELFQDKELHYLIRVALLENKDLLMAAARVAEARGDLDMDLVIAGGLTHDVGKLLEYVKLQDGSIVKSETGKLLRHPVTGMEIAKRAGAPEKLQHIIIVHSKEGEAVKRIPEAILIHHCDFIDFHIAKYHAGM